MMLALFSLLPFLATGAFGAPVAGNSIPISTNVIPFSGKVAASGQRQAARLASLERLHQSLTGNQHAKRFGPTTASLTASPGDGDYTVQVNIGGQTFTVVADTGSSDLWVASSKFQCVDNNNNPQPQSYCFPNGQLYKPSQHPFFLPTPYPSNFNITYGSGFVAGYSGYETATVGSLSVPLTEFSVATEGFFNSDGISSGILGLAAPALTSVYFGRNGANDGANNAAIYPPWFYTAVAEFQVPPYFSVLLQRPTLAQEQGSYPMSNFGSLTLGGRPNVPVTSKTVTVQNHYFETKIDGVTSYQPLWYTVQTDSINFSGSNNLNTQVPYVILDSGTTLIYLPNNIVDAFYAKWPGAVYNNDQQSYVVNCDGKGAPSLSFTIGGVTFPVTTPDLVYPGYQLPSGQCIGSVQYGGTDQQNDIFILGDRFLVNVLTTFNIINQQITITQRQPY